MESQDRHIEGKHVIPLRFAWVTAFALAASACQPDVAMRESFAAPQAAPVEHPATTEWGQDPQPEVSAGTDPMPVHGMSEGE